MQESIGRHAVVASPEQAEARLDLVVPFTTRPLTVAALAAANRLGRDLHTSLRLVKVQVVPHPLDVTQSPIPLRFLEEQLRNMVGEIPAHCEIRLAREFAVGLESALGIHSLVLLATPKRPWRTRNERLAETLRRDGYTVVLVREGKINNA